MGVRFALAGGKEGWARTVLTAVGVGLGVALLLLAASLPHALDARDGRTERRSDFHSAEAPAPHTVLVGWADTDFHGRDVRGRLLQAEGDRPSLPPGLRRMPAPGEMYASPALVSLLRSQEGTLLRERLPYRIAGTIGNEGLIDPNDLDYYAGADSLVAERDNVYRLDHFGQPPDPQPWSPLLILLAVVALAVLLTPVVVFVGTAIRFGGERRDRRLAALRLVGADAAAVRRIAAGEASAGAALGLLVGLGLFAVSRTLADDITLAGMRFFPADITPSPLLALLVIVLVPATAVLVALLAMRGVVVEPLGVVRKTAERPRRLWWRLLPSLVGLVLFLPLLDKKGDTFRAREEYQVAAGVVLLLFGVTALLPWIVQRAVAGLGGGPVSWQLAVRRLQLNSAAAIRPVTGIAVAVAGAIALGGLFSVVEDDFIKETGADRARAQYQVHSAQAGMERTNRLLTALADTKGVSRVTGLNHLEAFDADAPDSWIKVTVGDCASLREVAQLDACADGDAFILDRQAQSASEQARAGQRLALGGDNDGTGEPVAWTVPEDTARRPAIVDPTGQVYEGLLVTPGALPAKVADKVSALIYVQIDPKVPDAAEHMRNTVASVGPTLRVGSVSEFATDKGYASLRRGLLIGATAVLVLTGASLFVSQIEQLRERRKLLAVLVAFGTPRRALGLSVLWQTALPVVFGLVLAVATGLGLGAVLMTVAGSPIGFEWGQVGLFTAVGGGVVLLITLLSMPPLWRMMRPDGLRTE